MSYFNKLLESAMMTDLQKEISEARKSVHTDGYPMSIGELVNLYDDGEIDIRPEFQRLFRWKSDQKSKFIESILLGIPIPSIFVSQRDDGVWEIVDGLQRISTILELMGKLRNKEPLKLNATKYLPSLDGMMWNNNENPEKEIDKQTKLMLKREKIDIKIIKRESQADAKLELFQRLNSNGSHLSAQEIRNVILLMENAKAQHWLEKLANNENFQDTTPLSEKQQEEATNIELLIRYFSLRKLKKYIDIHANNRDIDPYLDAMVTRMFNKDSNFDFEHERNIFEKVFLVLNNTFGSDAFKKYNTEKRRYLGPFSTPIYELLTYSLSKKVEDNPNIIDDNNFVSQLLDISTTMESNAIYQNIMSRSRGIDRIKAVVDHGEGLL
ncbi:DUF262 domain-containing protein [Pasteurella multocida]|uniref:DUF262 domain-containing protein n=1 Tax=Pasteurella multocida TaxID=747 RepID=UPI002300DF81|nr:DUF262 domain-containing protein [Pasteurella multocida]MDA5611820.1 DUF262 domain-containing protein [Pasteurella multocida]MDA5614286.1 DUF262 domain-containing protein [Pasteurella multocida]